MKTLHRYVAVQFLAPFFLGLCLFTSIFFVDRLFDVLDKLLHKGLTTGAAIRLMAYVMPNLLILTVPMATLIAALVTFGRMSADGEIIAIRAAGVSLARLSLPVFGLATLITAGMLFFAGRVMPASNAAYRALAFEIFNNRASVVLRERIFVDAFDNYVFFVGKMDPTWDILENVIIQSAGGPGNPPQTIRARRGKLRKDPRTLSLELILQNGIMEWPRAENPSWFHQINFGLYRISLDMNSVLERSRALHPEFYEMTATQLLEEARRTDIKPHDQTRLLMEFHRRISLPFASLAVMLAAVPLGILFRRGGLMASGFAVVVIFVYYVFFALGETLGLGGDLPPLIACWLPNVVSGAAGGLLFYSAQRELSLPLSIFTWKG